MAQYKNCNTQTYGQAGNTVFNIYIYICFLLSLLSTSYEVRVKNVSQAIAHKIYLVILSEFSSQTVHSRWVENFPITQFCPLSHCNFKSWWL